MRQHRPARARLLSGLVSIASAAGSHAQQARVDSPPPSGGAGSAILVLALIAAVAVIAAGLFGLGRALRRRLAEREAQLQAASGEAERARAELRATEARYRGLFESSPDALMLLGESGFVDCNPATLTLFGCPDVESFRRYAPDALSPRTQPDGEPSRDGAARRIREATERGSVSFVWTHRRIDDGCEFVAEVTLARLSGPQPGLLQARVHDVTARLRVEAELAAHRARLEELVAERTAALDATLDRLRESQQRLSWAMDATRDGIWDWNLRTGVSYCNPAFHSMLGYEPTDRGEQPADRWVSLLHPEDRDAILEQGRRRLEESGGYELEFRLRCSDGSYKWILSRGKVVERDEQGRPTRAVGTHTDLSARKALELELRAALDEQTAIFEAVPEGIVLMRERRVVRCNRRLEEIFGYPRGGLEGLPTRAWYPDDASYQEVGKEIGEQVWRGQTHRRVVELQRMDGSRFWARITGRAVDPADPGKGMLGVIEDITEERGRQQAMREARDDAEAATRAKSEFLANMSHEIRTPMNAIIGMALLASKTELTPRQRDFLSKIQSAGQHLLGIINDILDFSKIESGKLELERADFDLDRVVDHVAALLGDKAGAKGLELVVEFDREIPRGLVGDVLRLEQVLLNLGSNAVKFTERGEVVVTARLAQRAADSVLLRFEVRDTGIGIAPQQRSQLFRSFQQADASITRRYGGTGLGLIISKRLVEQMGGEIGVDSVEGEGSTFWFTARFGLGAAPSRKLLPHPDLRGRRVLVVDDNPHARAVLVDMLEEMTFRVKDAASGAEAVERVRQADVEGAGFDLVFLDWRMPGLDGNQTARAIQALEPAHRPRLVMVTAYGREDVLREADAAGVSAVLTKPVSASTLFDAAMQVLGDEGEGDRAASPSAATEPASLAGLRGARILVVEDNDMNQEVARGLLEAAGFVVEVAGDGRQGVDKACSWPCDLVFMDMQMPVMDGLDATREIRRLDGFAGLPIVAMTANAMQQDRERCIEAGMNDFVAKPIDPDELWRVLLRWIPPREGSGTPAPPGAYPEPAVAETREPETRRPETREPEGGDRAFERIPGLDVHGGLRRMLGDAGVYMSMLRRFAADQRDASATIRFALDIGDVEGARRSAHTLKGLAGTLGAIELQQVAGEVEAAIGRGADRPHLDPWLESMAGALASLVAGIAANLPPEPSAAVATEVDPEALAAVCDRLEALLASDDAEALDVAPENAALLRAAFPDRFDAIAEAIRRFDFEHARHALAAARGRIPPK